MPDVGDLVMARVRATFCGQPIINSFSFALVSPFGTWAECAQTLADEMDSALGVLQAGGDWVTGLNVQYKVDALDVIDVFPSVAPLASFASAGVGTVTGDDALPPNDSLCATLRSEFKGPMGRGRVYLTGFSEGAQNAGFWEAGTQNYANAIMTGMLANFGEFAGATSFRWSVLHRYAGGAPVVPPEVKPIMSFTIHNEVRSIGRRAIGRRVHRRTAP